MVCRTKRSVKNEFISFNENLLAMWSYDGRIVYEKIIEATEGFDSKYCIASGAYGSVYKAKLPNNHIVAVKKLQLPVPDEDIDADNGKFSKQNTYVVDILQIVFMLEITTKKKRYIYCLRK